MLREKRLRILVTALLAATTGCLFLPEAGAQAAYKILHTFKGGTKDGSFPQSGVILDSAGNLYGTTPYGGAYGYGMVYKLTPRTTGAWSETVLHSFNNNGHDGLSSYSGLVFDPQGNLYGTAYYGGNGPCTTGQFPGCGTVFELSPKAQGGWGYKIIHTFEAGADGAWPSAALIVGPDGSLYGTTSSGGLGGCSIGGYVGCGTVFELTPSNGGWTETVLHSFDGGADGEFLGGGLTQDAEGNLYGSTLNGGSSGCTGNIGCGTVFELALSGGSWNKTRLYTFTGGADGEMPVGSLILDGAGNLYGATVEGGRDGTGTVFELTNSSGVWTETVLHSFCAYPNCNGGEGPFTGVVFDGAGNLYGTARNGAIGNVDGVVYKLTPNAKSGWKETVLRKFYNNPSGQPYSGVTFDGAGNLYGTTGGDNIATFGTVYELTP